MSAESSLRGAEVCPHRPCLFARRRLQPGGMVSANSATTVADFPGCSHPRCSQPGAPPLRCKFTSVLAEKFACRTHRFANRCFGNAAAPFFDDAFPSHSRSDLLQDVGHEDASIPKCRLTMAHLGIHHDVPSKRFFPHDVNYEYAASHRASTKRCFCCSRCAAFALQETRPIDAYLRPSNIPRITPTPKAMPIDS